jgi:hypothetical protein
MISDPQMQRQFRKATRAAAPRPHPQRAEMLAVLADARARIDRING